LVRRRSVPAGNGGERRRLREPWADSVGEEVEGGEAELLGASEELGAAQNDEGRRRQCGELGPWEKFTGERESRKKIGEGEWRGVAKRLQGVFSSARSRRWHRRWPGASHAAASSLPAK
jgi:hypothetical protein